MPQTFGTVKELLESLRPFENATPEGREIIEFTLKLERFSFGTLIKNPPAHIQDAVKLRRCEMNEGQVIVG